MQRARFGFGFELGENTRSGPRHARLRAVLLQPRKARCHVGISGDDCGFQVVRSLPRQKGRYFESFRTPCQRRFEDFLRGNRDLRREHEVPGGRQRERRAAARRCPRRSRSGRRRRTARRRPALAPGCAAGRATGQLPEPVSTSSTVAASEEPPPRPPPTGRFFSSARSQPLRRHRLAAAARRARRGCPRRTGRENDLAVARGAIPTRSQRSIRRNTVCSSW